MQDRTEQYHVVITGKGRVWLVNLKFQIVKKAIPYRTLQFLTIFTSQ